jgi:hypothetical protein
MQIQFQKSKKVWIAVALVIGGVAIFYPKVSSEISSKQNAMQQQSTVPVNMQASNQHGYFYKNNNQAGYIQWTEVDKQLSGQLQFLFSSTNPPQTKSESHAFKGVINSPNISITFTGNMLQDRYSGQTWTGTFNDKQLTLVVPSSDGKLNTVVFTAGTVEDFNQAVSSLQNTANQQAQAVQQQEANQKVEQQIQDTEKAIDNAMNNIQNGASKVANVSFDDLLQKDNKAWDKMQSDFQKQKNDMAQPLTGSQAAQVGSDVAVLGSDYAVFGSIKAEIDSRAYSVNNQISYVQDNINKIPKLWETVSLRGKYNTFNHDDIQAKIANANKQIASAQNTTKDAQNKSDSMINQANDFVKNAQDLANQYAHQK